MSTLKVIGHIVHNVALTVRNLTEVVEFKTSNAVKLYKLQHELEMELRIAKLGQAHHINTQTKPRHQIEL